MKVYTREYLLRTLQNVDASDDDKARFAEILNQVAALEQPSSQRASERVTFAKGLLNLGEARPTIRDRLIARFEIGPAQAYRDIDAALQSRAKTVSTIDAK